MSFLDPHVGRIYSLMRIVVGFLFLCHGAQKLLGVLGGMDALPLPAPLFYGALLIELVGGALVMVGFLTRPAAFLCSGTMAVAYLIAHLIPGLTGDQAGASQLLPIVNKGELAALYAWVFLFIAAYGAGTWSVDGERTSAI